MPSGADRPAPTPLPCPPGALGLAVAALRLDGPLILACEAEEEAERLTRLLRALAPTRQTVLLPPWDVPVYDRRPPSEGAMGRRVAALLSLEEASDPLLVTTVSALLQRVPPSGSFAGKEVALRVGEAVPDDLLCRLQAIGYRSEDRADDPGEVAFQEARLDLFPAQDDGPWRVTVAGGSIEAIAAIDRFTLHTTGQEAESLTLLPATELAALAERDPDARPRDLGRLLPDCAALPTLSKGAILLSAGAAPRLDALLTRHDEAKAAREDGHQLYLGGEDWAEAVRGHQLLLTEASEAAEAVPRFAMEKRPGAALRRFLGKERGDGRRVVLAGAGKAHERLLKAVPNDAARAEDWAAVLDAEPGALLALQAEVESGLSLTEEGVTIVAPRALLGTRAEAGGGRTSLASVLRPPPLSFGDAVVHAHRGIAELVSLEEAMGEEVIRLRFKGGEDVLVPVADAPLLWRYGPDPDDAPLGGADAGFEETREALEAKIAQTARGVAEVARARRETKAPVIEPDRARFERFAAGFPHALTLDQAAAATAVLEDLTRGAPTDRLVVGDVGYGKTEVALRAAAAVATAGFQVAVCVPTTVLCRQHAEAFAERFATLGIEVGSLSRLQTEKEAEEIKERLASGDLRVVVGTHALKNASFARLGLVVIDEEQRFGAADKDALRGLAEGVHVLTLTATPIPRTLAAAEAGMVEASVIATPPLRRQPVRTERAPFTDELLRDALRREARRGGQSFVVAPRIEDLERLAERIEEAVSELSLLTAHGRLPAKEVDEAMIRFARGETDVLLATAIVESGLDVPRANTMIVTHADRFGLAQLHQLRGRVGRGAARGVVWLTTEGEITEDAEARLSALTEGAHLGAGFDVSAQDLDQRGAGDLLGEEQAGHVTALGLELYRHLLVRALAAERGEAAPPEAADIGACAAGHLPSSYAVREELGDRFGPPPEEAEALLRAAELRGLCRRAGVSAIDAGPKAVALTFSKAGRTDEALEERVREAGTAFGEPDWSGGRLVFPNEGDGDPCDLARAVLEILADEAA